MSKKPPRLDNQPLSAGSKVARQAVSPKVALLWALMQAEAADYLLWESTGSIGALGSLIRLWPLHVLALACCYRPLLGAGISRNPKHCALTCFLPLSHAFSRHSHASGMLVKEGTLLLASGIILLLWQAALLRGCYS